MTEQKIALLFGATGGIGRAMAGLLAHNYRLITFSRADGFDLTDEASIIRAAESIKNEGIAQNIALVFDATGFLHDDDIQPEKSLKQLTPEAMAKNFALNCTGPALLMKYFLPLLPKNERVVFATLSAKVGSIGDNHLGGWYAYRAAKAALNQVVRTAAIELKRMRPEAILVALHPGTVDTGLSGQFAKSGLDVKSPERAAQDLMNVIHGLSVDDSGCFKNHDGRDLPW